ncbi:MAG: 30S ribosomal protein S4, partial [Pseudomonadota bacterium]
AFVWRGAAGQSRTAYPCAKQKLKGYYGNISERQFRRLYAEATRLKGSTSEQLIGLLERRLDAVVYRAKFVPTVFAARQFVNHGHVKVNGKRVTVPSYRVRAGDVVEVREKSRELPLVIEALKSAERDIPDYLDSDEKGSVKYVRIPQLADVPYPIQMEPNLVVEFYSR